jgi:hypothetical protein
MKNKSVGPKIITLVIALVLLGIGSWAGVDVSREVEQLTGIRVGSYSTEDYTAPAVGDPPNTPDSFAAARRLLWREPWPRWIKSSWWQSRSRSASPSATPTAACAGLQVNSINRV